MKIVINNGGDHYSGFWGFVARVVVMTLATLLAALFLPGVHLSGVAAAVVTAVVIALLNNFIRPILIVVTLPFTVLSMGLFLFVVNAVIVLLADAMISSFEVDGFGNALLFSVLLTLFNYLLELPNRSLRRRDYKPHDSSTDDDGFTPYEEVE